MALFGKKADKQAKIQEEKVPNVAAVESAENPALSLPFVLVQPRVSEKAGALAHLNKYVFIIKKHANKVEVKKAVESRYKVKVLQVNMLNTKGKVKNFGKTVGKTKGIRKAIVTLRKGDSIKGLTEVV